MCLDELPTEILRNIFLELSGRDVIQCRAVSRRLRDVIDGLSDSDWKRVCHQTQDPLTYDYIKAQHIYSLSWRDTYKSLNSWSKLHATPARRFCSNVKQIKIIPGGILACIYYGYVQGMSDTIVYYDAELSQCGREEFEFNFYPEHYEENEHFLVLVIEGNRLCIIIKANRRIFFFDNVRYLPQLFWLNDKEMFFIQNGHTLYRSKLDIIDNEISLNVTYLHEFNDTVYKLISKSIYWRCNNDKIHVLTIEGKIFVCERQDYRLIMNARDNFRDFNKYGFDWKCKNYIKYINLINDILSLHINLYLAHGPVMLAYKGNTILIYRDSGVNGINDLVKTLKSPPQEKITLQPECGYERQLEVLESANNHKIIALLQTEVFIVEIFSK